MRNDLSTLQRTKSILLMTVCVLALGACSNEPEEEALTQSQPADTLYNDARDALAAEEYNKAVETFQEVERQHPYSEWATHAQIMAAYTYYEQRKYDDAIGLLERFVKLHPSHPSTPYAYYMISLCYYEQISDVGRDQQMTDLAMRSLQEVAKRFPDSEYARDAKLKLDLTRDHLAGKEMEVGRYYLKRREYLAAINRFKKVIDDHQTTNHTPEALHRLVECYLALGVVEEAKKYAAVLGYNYSSSPWYEYSYALMEGKKLPESEDKGLMDKIKDVF